MSGLLIDIEKLHVRYGRRDILKGISLELDEGEVFALLGRNGAGKSSLIRCLLGLQRPQDGQCRLFGRDSWRHRASLMADIGIVPEEPDAPPWMTAKQLDRFGQSLYLRWNSKPFQARLERFAIPDRVPFKNLSKGQKNQVMLAFALSSAPRLLILDDPTLGLDAVARQAVFEELVVELADHGTATFMTSHDLEGIEGIATRTAFLRAGQLLADEELEDLKHRFRRLVLTEAVNAVEIRKSLVDFDPRATRMRGRHVEVLVAQFEDERFAAWQAQTGHRAEAERLSLEDIFVFIAGGTIPGLDHSTSQDIGS